MPACGATVDKAAENTRKTGTKLKIGFFCKCWQQREFSQAAREKPVGKIKKAVTLVMV
jgi:hypothetical protein